VSGIPHPVQVEPQHEVHVQEQPAPLVGRDLGARNHPGHAQRCWEVEIVVDRRHELVVQRPPGGGQGSGRQAGSVSKGDVWSVVRPAMAGETPRATDRTVRRSPGT